MNNFSTTKSYTVNEDESYTANRYNINKSIPTYSDPYEAMSRAESDVLSLPGSFMEAFPNLSSDRAHKYHARYLRAIASQLIERMRYKTGMSIQFASKVARDQCNTLNYDKARHSIWDIFHQHQPIINILDRGNNMTKKISNATISDQYYDLLIETADSEQILEIWFKDCGPDSDVVYVPVDMTSLDHFIMMADGIIANSSTKSADYISGVKRNRRHALMIQVVAQSMVDRGITPQPTWPHIPAPSAYGRRYYKGLSVQSVHKELRRAALGGYFQYDLHAAVYAIKLMIVQNIYKEYDVDFFGEFTYTKEYLELKSGIRKRLAKHIMGYPDPIKLVKQAITAVGFGARLQAGAWQDDSDNWHRTAISDIIKNEADRTRFMADPWVAAFVEEQAKMTDVMYEYYSLDSEFVQQLKEVPNMMTPSGRLKKNQVVAYLFQHAERAIMEDVFGDLEYTMDIHDAVVSKDRLDLLQIKTKLAAWSEFLQVEEDQSNGYYNIENDVEVQAHKAFIQQEERDAALYYGSHNKPGKVWRQAVKQHDGNRSAYTGSGNEVVAEHLWL